MALMRLKLAQPDAGNAWTWSDEVRGQAAESLKFCDRHWAYPSKTKVVRSRCRAVGMVCDVVGIMDRGRAVCAYPKGS